MLAERLRVLTATNKAFFVQKLTISMNEVVSHTVSAIWHTLTDTLVPNLRPALICEDCPEF